MGIYRWFYVGESDVGKTRCASKKTINECDIGDAPIWYPNRRSECDIDQLSHDESPIHIIKYHYIILYIMNIYIYYNISFIPLNHHLCWLIIPSYIIYHYLATQQIYGIPWGPMGSTRNPTSSSWTPPLSRASELRCVDARWASFGRFLPWLLFWRMGNTMGTPWTPKNYGLLKWFKTNGNTNWKNLWKTFIVYHFPWTWRSKWPGSIIHTLDPQAIHYPYPWSILKNDKLPSGNYGKSPCWIWKSTINHHFQSFFVCLPEGTYTGPLWYTFSLGPE